MAPSDIAKVVCDKTPESMKSLAFIRIFERSVGIPGAAARKKGVSSDWIGGVAEWPIGKEMDLTGLGAHSEGAGRANREATRGTGGARGSIDRQESFDGTEGIGQCRNLRAGAVASIAEGGRIKKQAHDFFEWGV